MTNIVEVALNAIEEFGGESRCISMGLRNTTLGQCSGPLEIGCP